MNGREVPGPHRCEQQGIVPETGCAVDRNGAGPRIPELRRADEEFCRQLSGQKAALHMCEVPAESHFSVEQGKSVRIRNERETERLPDCFRVPADREAQTHGKPVRAVFEDRVPDQDTDRSVLFPGAGA